MPLLYNYIGSLFVDLLSPFSAISYNVFAVHQQKKSENVFVTITEICLNLMYNIPFEQVPVFCSSETLPNR